MEDLHFLQSSLNGHSLHPEVLSAKFPLTKTPLPLIFIVEDDELLGLTLKKYLQKELATEVRLFTTAASCLEGLSEFPKEISFCLITDISLEQGGDGLLLVDILRERGLQFVSIAMTGFASIENAIAATKKGVFHYLTKPFELDALKSLVIDAVKSELKVKIDDSITPLAPLSHSLKKSQERLRLERPKEQDIFCKMIGRSQCMQEVFERIKKISHSDSTVLITGESGTGKELVASALHQYSSRCKQNRISVNCGAIPSELLESELFGHIKGSFTGAISNRRGRFELAHGGTLFLDEIGDMPLLLQVKLLRVLQTRQIEPVGGSQCIDVDVRIIAATHRDLEKQVTEGKFREDLFYRLNVIPIRLPSLKERKEDIPLLISFFLDKFVSADKRNEIDFSEQTLEMLLQYDWPGNVRELENVIERLVILRGGNTILPEDLPAKIFRHNPLSSEQYKNIFELPQQGIDLRTVLSDIEDSLIRQALGRTKGNKNQASKMLGLNRTTLIEKMKKKSIEF